MRADRAGTGKEGGGTHGAAAMAEADAEGREQDGAQELQAPAAARAQAHLGSDPRALLLLACFANSGKGNGWLFLPFELKELELPVARRGTGLSPASWGRSTNE